MTTDIKQIESKITEKVSYYKPYREVIKTFIEEILQKINKNACLEVYGSIATGLALDSSDMDLCICFDKYPFEDKSEEKEFLGNDLFPELS